MIVRRHYSASISGDLFDPDAAEKRIGVVFASKHRRGEPHKYIPGGLYEEGFAALKADDGFSFLPISQNDEILNFLEQNITHFRGTGATDIVLYYSLDFDGGCDITFAPDQLRRVRDIGATLALSCYETDDES